MSNAGCEPAQSTKATMVVRRFLLVIGLLIGGIAISLILMRFLITRSITCAPDCVGVNLQARDLHDSVLQKAQMIEAQLQSSDLSGANLREVDLSGANLTGTNLRNADLTDARLIGADLSLARLEGSILAGADLSGANLTDADLTGVDLRETLVSGAGFVKAKLTNAQLQHVNLAGLDFSDADLAGANLTGANLAGASLSRADLSGAILVQTDLTGAWLNLTNLVGANLTDADLAGSSMLGAQLASANFQSSNLVGAVLIGARLDGASLRGANLQDVRYLQTQLVTRTLQLDPVLQELNVLQKETILQDVNLSGAVSDGQTVWPAGAESQVAAGGNQLSLTIPTTATLGAFTQTTAGGLPVAKRLKVNFFVNALSNIRSHSGDFTSDFYLDLFWQEPTLAEGEDVTALDPTTLWDPQLLLVNSKNAEFLFKSYDNSAEPETNIHLSYRARGDFAASFDLHRFPFDQQKLSIKLEPATGNSDTALLEFIDLNQAVTHSEQAYTQTIPKGRYIDGQAIPREWTVQTAHIVQQLYVYPHDQSTRSRFQIELILARQASSYVWKYMAPLVLLALLGWLVCLIDGQALGFRLWLVAILFGALVAFHTIQWRTLPSVAYLTYLDRFLLLHYSLLSTLLGFVFTVRFLHQGNHPRIARAIHWGVIFAYPPLYVVINLWLYWGQVVQNSGVAIK